MLEKDVATIDEWKNPHDGWYCTECQEICRIYEQGLCCSCDNPWETEVMDEKDFPDKWIKIFIFIYRILE